MKKIKDLYQKYREIVNYLIVGVLTTIVSWLAYAVCKLFLDVEGSTVQMQAAVFIRWAVGVLFAYFTNRKYVFQSKNPHMLQEAFHFTTSRLVTYFMDAFIMWLLPGVLGVNDWVSTFISAVLVTVTNYIFSKFLVFSRKKGHKNAGSDAEDSAGKNT